MGNDEIWGRKYFTKSFGNPFLFYVIFGSNIEQLTLSKSRYDFDEIPQELKIINNDKSKSIEQKAYIEGFYSEYFGKILNEKDKRFSNKVKKCDIVTVVTGEFKDTNSLGYLKNTIGIIQGLLETGAVAILDPQIFQWLVPDEWSNKYFMPKDPLPRNHVLIIESEDDKKIWLHTRGMRKFGRPDISIRNITKKNYDLAVEIINRFIESFAFGVIPDEIREIKISVMKTGVYGKILGDNENPDFNNYYFEIEELK